MRRGSSRLVDRPFPAVLRGRDRFRRVFHEHDGNQDEMARVMGVAALLHLVLNGVVIPPFGAMGAAVATAPPKAGWHAWLNRLVARLSIQPSIAQAALRRIR